MAASASVVVANAGARRLRMILFRDYDDGFGGRFGNSPGLLPFVGSTREAGFDANFVTEEAELLRQAAAPEVDVERGLVAFAKLLDDDVQWSARALFEHARGDRGAAVRSAVRLPPVRRLHCGRRAVQCGAVQDAAERTGGIAS